MLFVGFFSPGFDFDFLNTSQEIGWEQCPQNHRLVSGVTLNFNSVNQLV